MVPFALTTCPNHLSFLSTSVSYFPMDVLFNCVSPYTYYGGACYGSLCSHYMSKPSEFPLHQRVILPNGCALQLCITLQVLGGACYGSLCSHYMAKPSEFPLQQRVILPNGCALQLCITLHVLGDACYGSLCSHYMSKPSEFPLQQRVILPNGCALQLCITLQVLGGACYGSLCSHYMSKPSEFPLHQRVILPNGVTLQLCISSTVYHPTTVLGGACYGSLALTTCPNHLSFLSTSVSYFPMDVLFTVYHPVLGGAHGSLCSHYMSKPSEFPLQQRVILPNMGCALQLCITLQVLGGACYGSLCSHYMAKPSLHVQTI